MRSHLPGLVAGLLTLQFAQPASAHFCNNIYDSPARIVVKPERATLFAGNVGDTETLRVCVRSNFPYVVSNAEMRITHSDFDWSVDPVRQDILPGQEVSFQFSITRTAGSGEADLALQIRLFTETAHRDEMEVWRDDQEDPWTRHPPPEDFLRTYMDCSDSQACQLNAAMLAEVYDLQAGLDQLIAMCGHPRLQYNTWAGYGGGDRWFEERDPFDTDTTFDWKNLLRCLHELAMLNPDDTRVPQAFIDHMDDPDPVWRGIAAVVGASLGDHPDVLARIQAMADTDPCVTPSYCDEYTWSPSADARLLAKAALVVRGDNQHLTEVSTDCLGHSSAWLRVFCAAALGLAGEDTPVLGVLIPEAADDYDAVMLTAPYVLQLVAVRRGENPTFYDNAECIHGCEDADGDGYSDAACGGTDCDDADPGIHIGSAESCNGRDDDCDGLTDEPWPLVGAECTAGVGACEATGTIACSPDGSGAACDAVVGTPSDEVCDNNVDEDCDGALDNGCMCSSGDTRSCYGGPQGTEGVGPCRAGEQTCADSQWGACSGQVLPGQEDCGDDVDNDCDGATDGDDGDCGGCPDADGDMHQRGDCGGDDCDDSDASVHPGASEICNDGADNDCDGLADSDDGDCVGGGKVEGGCACGTGAPRFCLGLLLIVGAVFGAVLRRRKLCS